ncbi:hypothetical protein P5P86_16780 [Nocardioides sp. BP30]|uniref:beta family protein n=1 Tax=Nocardioides sp. BP30 TaxID=3036374 RepID=UPI0024699042|nr:hypothetical protein [Nocardioides sp. BP30]WGL54228.1 hypothetical protein P5P86_16780 [Nocardioides sp. BP30]
MKGKAGEIQSLEGVLSDHFVPLIELAAASKCPDIAKRWYVGEAIWIQPVNLDGAADPVWAQEIDQIFADLQGAGREATPVILLEEPVESIKIYETVLERQDTGAVLRVDAEDLIMSPPKAIVSDVDDFLILYGLDPEDCDLVIDAALIRDSVPARVATVNGALAVFPYLDRWRSLVLVFSAFPEDMGAQAPKSSVHPFPRDDREAYLALVARGLPRDATYGDFAVGQPSYGGVPYTPVPNIKYTCVDVWRVHRGASRNDPSPQYIDLAKGVAASPYFRGNSFSAGDSYIASVANGSDGPGNATTYLRAAMSHHVLHVLDRLATHGEP